MENQNIIIYNTSDGKASVALFAKDGNVWMNQSQLAELFDTSKQNISQHVNNILKDNELDKNSVVKNYLTTHLIKVIAYINNQKEHHKRKLFKDEYKDFLMKYRIEHKDEYLFNWIES